MLAKKLSDNLHTFVEATAGKRTWIEIDRHAALANARVFRKLVGPRVRLWAVVKSNAYGHGLVQVAKQLALFKREARRRQLRALGVVALLLTLLPLILLLTVWVKL